MKKIFSLILAFSASFAFGDIFTDVAKLEKLDSADTTTYDALNTQEYISEIFYIGEKNPRFELSFPMRARKDALQIRLDYPDAWRIYRSGNIENFSYFGFKLWDLKQGYITEEQFLKELQGYIQRMKN